jgi:hypothetical protein
MECRESDLNTTFRGAGRVGGHHQGWIGLEVLSPNKMTAGHEAYSIECAPRAQ